MNQRAVCISCFHYYDHRIRLVEDYLLSKGYDCTYIISDFSHIEKKHFRTELEHCIQIPAKPYYKNLSVARLRTHAQFARDAFRLVEKLSPDFLYVMVPPNSVARQAAKYKKRHPNVKLVLDLYDLWPETFPNNRAKQLLSLPFAIWRSVRDCGIPAADLIFTECELYQDRLKKQLTGKKTEVLYLCRSERTAGEKIAAPDTPELHLCYLGSINNIIDIPTIAKLIGTMVKLRPVTLHVIGDGESREVLIETVRSVGAQVVFHGKIYDVAKRQDIFDLCSFGVNIMKDSVCVGLTMKSLDYFAGGLPILNTIEGDTYQFVEEYDIGINVKRENIEEAAHVAVEMTSQENLQMRKNTLFLFSEQFSESVFQKKIAGYFNEICNVV